MAKLHGKEVVDAVEILATDNPKGVDASQIWASFFQDQCKLNQVTATLYNLCNRGLVRRREENPGYGKAKLFYLPAFPQKKSIPCALTSPVVTPTPLPLPSLKNGDLKELRTCLAKAIDAMETIQDQIQPLLAGLLDLDRDCEKLEKVKDIMAGMKALVV